MSHQNNLKTYIYTHTHTIVSDMLEFYNVTVSLGENIVNFKISDRNLFRGDLFIEKST